MFKLVILIGLITSIYGQCTQTCIPRGRCDADGGPVVFGLVDGVCRVFKNKCIYDNVQCMRINSCSSLIIKSNQPTCLALCETCVNEPLAPVCARFPNREVDGSITEENLSFMNSCELRKYSCLNSRAFDSERSGYCT